jgi:hypothetical protein
MKAIAPLMLIFLVLQQSNGFAEVTRCEVFSKNIDLAFPKKDNGHINLTSKKDYTRMKEELAKIDIDQPKIDQYLTELNDGKTSIKDVTDSGEIFRAACAFAEVKATNALFKYAEQHPELKNDLILVIKARILKYDKTPSLILLLIQMADAKKITAMKAGEDSQLVKDLEAVKLRMLSDNKRLFSSQSKILVANKKDEEYSEKEIKEFIELEKEEADLSKKYFKELSDLVVQI